MSVRFMHGNNYPCPYLTGHRIDGNGYSEIYRIIEGIDLVSPQL